VLNDRTRTMNEKGDVAKYICKCLLVLAIFHISSSLTTNKVC